MKQKLFSGTRALVMGLGLHGGGVATVKWLVRHGAAVTATDMRSAEVLAPSVRALKGLPVRFALGGHVEADFRTHDLVVVNPGVPRESTYLTIARESGARIENDASIFFRHSTNPAIAVTGTRGKTTTTLWIAELLKKRYPAIRPSGNTPENALLKEFDRVEGKPIPVLAELSSWQLEYLPQSGRAPCIALITNLFPDHLNRYGGKIEAYADAKAGIFAHQIEDDVLILNRDNVWWKYFANKNPKSRIFFTSMKPPPRGVDGMFVRDNSAILRVGGIEESIVSIQRFAKERGFHNVANLLQALLAALLFEPALTIKERDILTLPTPMMRQEVIARRGKLMIVNDSCATSPDGTIAAIERFAKDTAVILITGGTDKELEFGELARMIKKHIPSERLILLEGSATTKLSFALREIMSRRRLDMIVECQTLEDCVREALHITPTLKGKCVILFSPGAASFEKFLHEFDRGKKFTDLIVRAYKS
jgi:UDP-N-acetylmuramoylalanine--D-glutamate ligase